MIRFIRGLLGILFVLALWQLGSFTGVFPEDYIPPPTTVLPTVVKLFTGVFDDTQGTFVADFVATMAAWFVSLLIAIGIAVPLGLLLGSVPLARTASRVIVEFLRPIPSVALIPLVIIMIGSGPEAKISLSVFAAIWPILFNTIYALDEIDPLQLDTARSFGLSRARTMLRVGLPNAAPFVFTGIRLASAVVLIVVISTEYLASGDIGLGRFILTWASGTTRPDIILAVTVLAGLIGYLLDNGFLKLQRVLFKWNQTTGAAV
ncbi:ABC transporter permease [Actinocrispum wychmicini]|uniref:NitT/TauT family transport system permease protein n=1 Tax=Actinocrispum wychmicini TaxID=1213861 RepID=A0A4R2JM06_9PSEU|nr:ABC transporter permease [Actinocrispum wychmicini]TCO58108.1 NitT/TauT family transport system permease protein [Actinocrispum wychmicini]